MSRFAPVDDGIAVAEKRRRILNAMEYQAALAVRDKETCCEIVQRHQAQTRAYQEDHE